jgi:tRNA(Ile)-lysidine synthase
VSSPLAAAELPDRAQKYLVAVSGGRDSMALLHWLLDGGCRQLVVCHLDHGLRPTSAQDAEFVRAHAHVLRLPEVVARVEISAARSVEAAAREARYSFLARAAREQHCNRIILAHHADDQVETFLFNLLRGGPGAMRAESTRVVDGTSLRLLRPLLGVWREEIDAYISANRVPFREDESNTDPRFTRNRLRHDAIPALNDAMNRDVRRSVWRAAEILAAEDDFLAARPEVADSPAELEVPALRSLPLALQRRLVLRWLTERGVESAGFDEVERVLGLLGDGAAKVNLPGDLCARRREKRIFIDHQ